MKKLCKARKNDNSECEAAASESGYCFAHDPARGQERAAARRKGGQATRAASLGNKEALPTSVRTVGDVLTVLDYSLIEAIALQNSVQRGRLLVSICSGYLEAIKIGEFETRLEAIEQALAAKTGALA